MRSLSISQSSGILVPLCRIYFGVTAKRSYHSMFATRILIGMGLTSI